MSNITVKLGKSFGTTDVPSFHSFSYNFLPGGIDNSRVGHVFAEPASFQVQVQKTGSGHHIFKGKSVKTPRGECFLIFDRETGECRLERCGTSANLTHENKAQPRDPGPSAPVKRSAATPKLSRRESFKGHAAAAKQPGSSDQSSRNPGSNGAKRGSRDKRILKDIFDDSDGEAATEAVGTSSKRKRVDDIDLQGADSPPKQSKRPPSESPPPSSPPSSDLRQHSNLDTVQSWDGGPGRVEDDDDDGPNLQLDLDDDLDDLGADLMANLQGAG